MRTAGMLLRQLLLVWTLVALTGCAQRYARPQDDPAFSTVGFLRDHSASQLSGLMLVAHGRNDKNSSNILPFKIQPVWEYVQKYGPHGNNCPQGQFDSDCAHFQSHALWAAGIRVDQPSAACVSGLSLRVKDLAMAFDNSSKRYENVHKFTNYHQARRGDYCFLPRIEGANNDHMMLLAATPDADGALVWSHTNNRLGTHAPFDPARCVFYRIDDR
jgi:hypothetical protein